ncbi:MAG: dual specificity protein phosphatase family protein, partial [Anaerolineales bacterium]|nr:dual specificity protein phosphatase family protein [Anaerolineales bacterium]
TEYLYVAASPNAECAGAISDLNVRLVINMIFITPAKVYQESPFRMLTLRTFDSIFIPIPIRKLEKGVKSALPAIQNSESVLIYCRQGRHRSVAMASTILIAKGYSADDAMQLVSSKRKAADPYAWHIQRQIRKFEKKWNNHKNSV